jgi:hypothetical protein
LAEDGYRPTNSIVPPMADIDGNVWHVRFVPNAGLQSPVKATPEATWHRIIRAQLSPCVSSPPLDGLVSSVPPACLPARQNGGPEVGILDWCCNAGYGADSPREAGVHFARKTLYACPASFDSMPGSIPILRKARWYFSSTSPPKIKSGSASQCSQPLSWISVSNCPGAQPA